LTERNILGVAPVTQQLAKQIKEFQDKVFRALERRPGIIVYAKSLQAYATGVINFPG
jgi:hypothetical protein